MAEFERKGADEFYVGYLPMPPGHRRFLGRLLPVLGGAGLVAAVMVAAAQRHPGRGVWERTPVALRGVLRTEPYPMVEVEEAGGGVVLLVEAGKHGAQARAGELGDGRAVSLTGTLLRRGRQRMLELSPGPDGISPDTGLFAPAREEEDRGPATLRGEIVDAKCSLGAMKPGDGKAHKACATLCLQGGIPAAFVAEDGSWYLLADERGGRVGDDVIAYVGEPVTVTGRLHQRGRLTILRVSKDGIRRL